MSGIQHFSKVILVLVSVFLLIGLSSPAAAEEGLVLTNGKVTHVNVKSNTLTLRIPSSGPRCPERELTFVLNSNLRVLACDGITGPAQIRAGDDVVIAYHEIGGVPVLDRVALDVPAETYTGGFPSGRF